MPYVITVNRPGFLPEADPVAVATLEDAREVAHDEIGRSLPDDRELNSDEQRADRAARLAARDIGASGGCVPLPGGYVVDVQPLGWIDLERLARGASSSPLPDITTFDSDDYRAQILDAYNGASC